MSLLFNENARGRERLFQLWPWSRMQILGSVMQTLGALSKRIEVKKNWLSPGR